MCVDLVQVRVTVNRGLAWGMSHEVLAIMFWHAGIFQASTEKVAEVLGGRSGRPAEFSGERAELGGHLVVREAACLLQEVVTQAEFGGSV
jgi:hypothetical protein